MRHHTHDAEGASGPDSTRPTRGNPPRGGTAAQVVPAAARVLLVMRGGARRTALLRRLATTAGVLDTIDTAEAALARLVEHANYDLVLADAALPADAAYTLCERVRAERLAGGVALLDDAPTLDGATRALQAGAVDLIAVDHAPAPAPAADPMPERLASALARARAAAEKDRRLRRLEKLCHRLGATREEESGRLGELAGDLLGAYRDLSDQVGELVLASELEGLLRRELDVEEVLRTLLEYLLAKVGSTNAGVFLPTSGGDWSLGAYINYDGPRDAAEVMLDQLADVLAPRFEQQTSVRKIESPDELAATFGEHAHWLEGKSLLVVACREAGGVQGHRPHSLHGHGAPNADAHDDECLAVVALFRDRLTPFTRQHIAILQLAAELFGRQLARVIRVHHRGAAKDDETRGADDFGLAA